MTAHRTLAAHHRAMLEQGSAIAPEVIAERGYWTAGRWQDLDGLGFRGTQKRPECFPALVVPQHDPSGEQISPVLRYDRPRTRRNGDVIKYEQPAGVGLRLDVPPRCIQGLRDPTRPLWPAEGAKKADALASLGVVAVNTPGVDGWRSPTAIPDLYGIPLKGRAVVCAYDNDVLTKPNVRRAVEAIARWMAQKGADVHVLDWARAELPPGDKVGVDDFLAAGQTLADLQGLVVPLAAWLDARKPAKPDIPYEATPAGLVWLRDTKDGPIRTPLTNFSARIVADVAEDDGAETRHLFELEATLHGRVTRFQVPAEKFAGMNWPTEQLGAKAIVFAGLGAREHARVATQMLSGDVDEQRVHTVTGWRRLGDAWAYLHGGGAIGPIGPVPGIQVRLPDALNRYVLPDPSSGDLIAAVRASMRVLDVVPDEIGYPSYGAVWRAGLGAIDFAEHLSGPTGAGKSEFAALMQQHYGSELDARHLPGSWSSTGNSLETLGFSAKDAILTVDDFAPTGSMADQQRYHRDADRLFRAQGNNSGRQRLRADATLRAAKPPRGLILSTGEDVPRGQSLRARLLVLEMEPGALDWGRLSACQADASAGLYAQALAGFIRWLAPHYEDVRKRLRDEVTELRQAATRSTIHKRTPEIVANLALGLRYFLTFARQVGALTDEEVAEHWRRGWVALGRAAGAQASHQAASEPARRFLELLGAAIASGRAHIADEDGEEPRAALAPSLGWRHRLIGSGDHARQDWQPQGLRVGWNTADGIFLEPDAAYRAAQEMGNSVGDPLAVGTKTLAKRLAERNLLASTEQDRGHLTVRRSLEGKRRNVLHLHRRSVISTESAQSAQSAQSDPEDAVPLWSPAGGGPILWADFPDARQESAQENRPSPADDQRGTNDPGPIGPIGPIVETHTPPKVNARAHTPSPEADGSASPSVSRARRSVTL